MRARLRPMGVGDILDETFRLYRENFTLFLATVAVLEVPAQIINLLLTLSAPAATTLPAGQTPTDAQVRAFVDATAAHSGLTFVTTLVTLLATALASAALAIVISNRYLNRPITVGDAYRAALNRLGPLVVAILWTGFRLILLVIACIVLIGIPFLIYFAVAWSLLSQVVMLENASGLGASRRSRELIQGYWWKTLGLLIVVGLLVWILSSIPTIIAGAIFGAGVGPLAGRILIVGLVGLIIGVIVRPIQIIAPTLLFYDLKIRKEAFDLEAMAQQAAAPPTYAPPTYTGY
jgi:hypothetical protein